MPTGPVLAATDLSGEADEALRQGWRLAAERGSPLQVCHVLPEAFNVRVLFPQDAGFDVAVQQEIEQRAAAAVTERVRTILGPESSSVEVVLETGSPHAGIMAVAEASDAAVIVVGPGTTALRLARALDRPVVIARPSPTGGSVLGTTDFSDPALPAVQMAIAEAARRDVPLRLIHCIDVDVSAYLAFAGLPGGLAMSPVPESLMNQMQAEARDRLAASLEAGNAKGECLTPLTSPAAGIIAAADAVATALVVVGTRGRTGLARLTLGSVAEAVMDQAPCSAMVVPLHPGS